jgi:ATP-dependent helicase/nuclease subunit A
LSDLWAETRRIDVWLLLRLALDRTAYETTLALRDQAGEGGGRQLSNVHKFLGLAREKGGSNLSDFLRRMTDLRAAEAREGEALGREPESGAVQLMSIHASKGLEFSVVAVADLGRSPMSSSDYILHDPEIGLVCKVRDENGDWQSPPSYGWGRWQVEQMEEAENRRLLYVACTRAADRLILSGKLRSGKQKGWLGQILAAWSIEPDGDEETLLHHKPSKGDGPHFRVRVYRPTEQPDAQHSATAKTPSQAGLTQMPALSRPLDGMRHRDAVTVTRFLRDDERLSLGDEELPSLHPAVRPMRADQRLRPVPRYLLGNIVHRALDDWDLLGLPSSDMHKGVFGIARSLGIGNVSSAEDAARKAARLIGNLKATPLYDQIQLADRRLPEVPFTLTTNQGILHGVIDLLFENDDGWHLIDWKSEWAASEDVERKNLTFLPQLAVYNLAARQILGIQPRTGVCLLSAQAALRWFTDDEMARSLAELGLEPAAS